MLSFARLISYLLLALGGALVVMVGIHMARTPAAPAAAGTTAEPLCDDRNPCTLDVRGAVAGTCEHRDHDHAKRCSDACVTNGHCSGNGECQASTPQQCAGYCVDEFSSCEDVIQFDVHYLSESTPFLDLRVVWVAESVCFAHACTAYTLDTYMLDVFGPEPLYLASIFTCEDYLDPDFRAAHGDCIVTQRHLLDMNLTSAFIAGAMDDIPAQLSVCTYAFACGPARDTALLDDLFSASVASLATRRPNPWRSAANVSV
jgi:hypothetical protein